MKKQTLYILSGLGFAGKSTLAKAISKHTGAVLISQDETYFEKKKELKHLDEDTQWETMLDISKKRIKNALSGGNSVVFDNTNTRHEHREELREIAKEHGASTIVVHLNTPDDLLVKRQEKNKTTQERHDVSQRHLDEARDEFETPSINENTIEFTPKTNINEWLKKLDAH